MEDRGAVREVGQAEIAHELHCLCGRVGDRPSRASLSERVDAAADKASVGIEFRDEQRCEAVVAGYPDAVVGGEITEAVCDQPAIVYLDPARNVRAMTDDQISAGLHRGAGK